jgi:PAS domain S-box-containing protein
MGTFRQTSTVAKKHRSGVSSTNWKALYLEEKQARERSEAQVQHLNDVLVGLGDGLVMLDANLCYDYVNDFTLHLMQKSQDEVLGRSFYELYPQLKGTSYDEALQTAVREQRQIETDVYYPSNGRFWRTRINPTGNGVTIYFRDVTDLRATEVLQKRLAAIVESSDDAIIGKTLEGIITDWNPAAERIFGYTAEEIIGKPKALLFPPDRLEEEKIILKRLMEGIVTDHSESIRLRKDGTLINVSVTISPIRDNSGRIIGASTIARDITASKQLEQRLREETNMLETLYQFGQQLSAELDLEKLVQAVTDIATEQIGAQFGAFFYNVVNTSGESYTLYTISGVPRERFSRFPMPRNTAVFAPTFNGEGTVRSEDITRHPLYGKNPPYHGKPDGHLPVVSYLAVSVVSRSGEVLGGLFFGHEQAGIFSERHERMVEALAAHAAIAIDNARLFQAERERSEQLAIAIQEVHHRVKNSLQGVSALLEMQIEPEVTMLPVETLLDSLSQIKTIALVHDLLAHDQPMGQVDIAEVLTKLVAMLSITIGTIENPTPICLEVRSLWVPIRPATSLALVINELVTNAVKHSHAARSSQEDLVGNDLQIAISMQQDEENVCISVQDNGPGFPFGFDPVRNANLGLELVQTLVSNDLKGNITFQNGSCSLDTCDGDRRGAHIKITFAPARLPD